ncbi:MAG: hypothetical protein AMS22_03770 [Thiotrichales bacterium SG8_50]|nr:MAG: hypothetical protein AMS22_03770 [Thiotrichales bacterium SG8_50]
MQATAYPLDRLNPAWNRSKVSLLGPPSPIVPIAENRVGPVHDAGLIRMLERLGDDHYHSVFELAAWRDAKGKVTDLPVHDLLR